MISKSDNIHSTLFYTPIDESLRLILMWKVHNKTHSGRHTAQTIIHSFNHFYVSFPSPFVVRYAGAEYFIAAQLYIQLSLHKSNIYDDRDVDDSKKKMGKQLVGMVGVKEKLRKIQSQDFYTKSFLCFTACCMC